ncbi:hypothetical protein ACOMICROBIO_EPCKBFOG_02919 [Vibrio sp. B1FLJ16]|nr:hypothetical protein ACOMICROBIO_EPCKBFOG_02919 [Vibrio sp. B1FLJ16]CAE6925006.1 hypothetical protein ACOMICROBIO_EPCKBFOG_02919 [Vibrio sp. B1FLJ16]
MISAFYKNFAFAQALELELSDGQFQFLHRVLF